MHGRISYCPAEKIPDFLVLIMLRGARFISAPFLHGKKTHAGAKSLVVARRLARILERRVNAGSMSASAFFARQLRRNYRSTATASARWSSLS
jgi:hypothetical protein